MILVDTSVWIDHFRAAEPELVAALNAEQVVMHPFVVGELTCGNLKNRQEIIALLRNLPPLQVATENQALDFIERHQLMGRGIGYIDVHLLAATALANPVQIWTQDKRLAAVAATLNLTFKPETH